VVHKFEAQISSWVDKQGLHFYYLCFLFSLQLDPPNSMQLYLRGASVCFLFEQAWNLSAVQQGKWLRILPSVTFNLFNFTDNSNVKM